MGVVWHTQGSGKSLTMAFYAGRIIREPAMGNPTLVVLTDRNDLDDQLFATFARCRDLLRQPPVQAESRAHLRELLAVEAGGVVFTTIHKFFPEEKGDRHPTLSERRNIVVIADEAHRSQYDFIDGYARHMRDALPHASFIGFTGTPIELADANTRAVFGDYISVYDIQRAVQDGAPRCPSITRAGWQNSRSMRPSGRRSTPASRRPPRARRSSARRSSRPSGRSSKPWSARTSASRWWPATSWSTSSSGWRRWTARR
ncbi:MAG: DEAD/DEAH box helicase family protein [Candidatus Manganitrophus sp.]|nr:MAG: DEAD/DEAH box helicase family protein [Candidatus Manganitrophus sp.]